jgi:hypothetical protein
MSWSDADAFTEWLKANYGKRWHERWEEYGFLDPDPRSFGPHRWSTVVGKLVVRMVDELPPAIEVRHDGRSFRTVPLPEVEATDPCAAELLHRHRTLRAQVLSGGGPAG